MDKNELRNKIYSKLSGEGGLNTDFNPYGTDKTVNMECAQILAKLNQDENFFIQLTDCRIGKYNELCVLRGLNPEKVFDRVMTPYDCVTWARYYGKQILEGNYNDFAKKGR